MATDIERAYEALNGKNALYTQRWRYADGDHPLTYTNARLKEVFQSLDARFTENWCGVVIGATLERIELGGFELKDAGAQTALMDLWQAQDLAQDADDAHEAALVCGESFLVVWPDEAGQPQAYYNDPRLCHVFYDAENPRTASVAAKWWNADDGTRRLTLYYRDHLEYYVSTGKAENVSSAQSFRAADVPTAPNPYDEIPVFHFRPHRRALLSDLGDVIPLQNGINKLLADMMVAAEYGAFAQRYVISNADTAGKLKNAPNEIWSLPAGDGVGQQTQVGQFAATELRNYLDAIDRLAQAVAVITRTPKHYLLAQGGDPSGEALIAMEAPLVRKAQKRIERFTPTWAAAAAFLLRLMGYATVPADVTVHFDEPATVQPRTEAEIRQMSVAAGLPLETVLRREGWSEDDLAAMRDDKDEEAQASTASLAAALTEQQRRFDSGQGGQQATNAPVVSPRDTAAGGQQ